LILFLVLFSFAVAEECPPSTAQPGGCDSLKTPWMQQACGLLTTWQTAIVLALIISTVIVSLAYMFGSGFEMPDLKAWAQTEVSQIIATAIICAAFVAVLAFVEFVVGYLVSESRVPGLSCAWGSCLNATASFYFEDYSSTMKESALAALKESVENVRTISSRYNVYCSDLIFPIPCLQFGMSLPNWGTGEAVLNSERAALVFEYYQNLLSSIEAQKFFVTKVAPSIGPILLAFGIFGRSFFFTRRLGGLLIAVAIGIMVVLPLMYMFDWLAMQITLYGDASFSGFGADCPSECQKEVPVAYMEVGGQLVQFNNTEELTNFIFNSLQDSNPCSPDQNMNTAIEIAVNLSSGVLDKYAVGGRSISSCEYEASHLAGFSIEPCPVQCRQLPYPYWSGECANYSKQSSCSMLTEKCKLIRFVENVDVSQSESCPAKCKIIPPLKNNCFGSLLCGPLFESCCLLSRADCRVYYYDGSPAWEEKVRELQSKKADNAIKDAIKKCKLADNCTRPALPPSGSALDIAKNTCVYIYPEPNDPDCTGCIFTEKAYLYNPPIRPDDECKALCTPRPSGKQKTGEDIPLLVEGNIGPVILTNVSKLLVPVYLLPIFNFLVVVMFIRSFSKFLGGDIEIPGLAKVL